MSGYWIEWAPILPDPEGECPPWAPRIALGDEDAHQSAKVLEEVVRSELELAGAMKGSIVVRVTNDNPTLSGNAPFYSNGWAYKDGETIPMITKHGTAGHELNVFRHDFDWWFNSSNHLQVFDTVSRLTLGSRYWYHMMGRLFEEMYFPQSALYPKAVADRLRRRDFSLLTFGVPYPFERIWGHIVRDNRREAFREVQAIWVVKKTGPFYMALLQALPLPVLAKAVCLDAPLIQTSRLP